MNSYSDNMFEQLVEHFTQQIQEQVSFHQEIVKTRCAERMLGEYKAVEARTNTPRNIGRAQHAQHITPKTFTLLAPIILILQHAGRLARADKAVIKVVKVVGYAMPVRAAKRHTRLVGNQIIIIEGEYVVITSKKGEQR